MGRRHLILIAFTIAFGLLLVPAAPAFARVPELLIPAFAAYGMAFLAAFRVAVGRSLVIDVLTSAGLRVRPRPRAARGGLMRIIAKFFLATCGLVSLAAGALWVRSYRVCDDVQWARWDVLGATPSRWVRRYHHTVWIASDQGGVSTEWRREIILDPQFVLDKELAVAPKPWSNVRWTDDSAARRLGIRRPARSFLASPRNSAVLNALGVQYGQLLQKQRLRGDPSEGTTWFVMPWRLVCLTAALPPLVAGMLWLKRLRPNKPGSCAFCGYDLRASPGRCPECGEAAADAASNTLTASIRPGPAVAALPDTGRG